MAASKPASPKPAPKRVICWAEPRQAGLLREVAGTGQVGWVGAGSPNSSQAGAVAAELGTQPLDDLRVALTEGDAEAVLIAAAGDFGRSDPASDAPALLAARARGVKVFTLEPFPVSAIDLASRGWLDVSGGVRPADVARVVPLARHTRAFRDADEVRATLGEVRSVSIEALAGVEHGSLGARLVAALDTVLLLLGEPDTIDAAYCSPLKTAGLHALPGETLAGLHGDMALSLRFSGGRAASILASDHAGTWGFRCNVLGSGGRLHLHDSGFELFGVDGARLDESRAKKGKGTPSVVSELIAEGIVRGLDPHFPDLGPPDWVSILSMAQAALLSARTGQGESPAMFRGMMGRG